MTITCEPLSVVVLVFVTRRELAMGPDASVEDFRTNSRVGAHLSLHTSQK